MAKELNEKFENSTGIFADPVTFKALTGKEERVQTCPDEKTFKYPKIKIGEKEYRLASRLWNETERKAYSAYKKGLGSGTSTRESSKIDVSKIDALDEFLKTALKGKELEQALALTKALRPEDPVIAKAKKQVANMTPEQKALFMELLSA